LREAQEKAENQQNVLAFDREIFHVLLLFYFFTSAEHLFAKNRLQYSIELLSFLKVANIDYLLRLQVTYLSLKL
jgi:hypothetical protein